MSEVIETKVADLNGAINQLIADVHTKQDELDKKIVHNDTFETYKANAEKRLNELSDEVIKLKTPPMQVTEDDKVRQNKQKAFATWLRKGELGPEERKVLTIADSTHAGVLAPYEYVRDIIKGIELYSPIRTVANVRQTTAYAVELPTETAVPAAAWVAESIEKTEITGLTYGLTEIKTFEMYHLLKATQKMLEDSAFNLEAEIASVVSRKFGTLEGTAFWQGNGTSAPEGIRINATVLADATNLVTDNVLAFADFLAVQYALASPYVRNAVWLLNRATLGYVLGLKSATTNTYLLQPNLQQGQPATILGSPIVECPDITAGSGACTDALVIAAYGDFRAGYTIVDRIDIIIQRLTEKYAEFGMIGFLARKRVGGAVVLPEAIQLLKNQTTG